MFSIKLKLTLTKFRKDEGKAVRDDAEPYKHIGGKVVWSSELVFNGLFLVTILTTIMKIIG